MKLDIVDYVTGCAECQCHKVNLHPTKVPLQPIYPKPEAMPFEMVAIDLITKLLELQGYDSILTITNHDCTKAAIFIPCNKKSMQKALQHYTSSTYLYILDSLTRSSATVTPNSCLNSQESYARLWALAKTLHHILLPYRQPIRVHQPMG